jgi:hypothetical protein
MHIAKNESRRRANFVGTKFGGGESEGGAGIPFPQPPFLPAAASTTEDRTPWSTEAAEEPLFGVHSKPGRAGCARARGRWGQAPGAAARRSPGAPTRRRRLAGGRDRADRRGAAWAGAGSLAPGWAAPPRWPPRSTARAAAGSVERKRRLTATVTVSHSIVAARRAKSAMLYG